MRTDTGASGQRADSRAGRDPVARPSPPAVAVICNSLPPYRVHLHRRIAREMADQITLWTIVTHESSDDRWGYSPPEEIRPVSFGPGESFTQQGNVRYLLKEWHKGGRIIRWMRDHDVRAVVMLGYNDAGRLRIIRWCRRRGVPVLIWGDSNIHGDVAQGWRAILKKALLRRVIDSSSGVLACGDLGKAFFRKHGADDARMFYHPYEPDYELIQQLKPEVIEQVGRSHNLAPGRRRLIFSGRLVEAKRPDLVIDAFAAIAAERPDWDLLMVGDGPLREALAARVPEALRGRILWTGFVDDQCTMSALYRLSDVLVLPSDYEPWALVVNEAAAAGLAMVCSSVVGAAHELVRDGVNGWLFERGSLATLTKRLRNVTDPGRIDPMKAASGRVLTDWRERADPVNGLRQALRFLKVIA